MRFAYTKYLIVLLVCSLMVFTACSSVGNISKPAGPYKVGEVETVNLQSPHPYPNSASGTELV